MKRPSDRCLLLSARQRSDRFFFTLLVSERPAIFVAATARIIYIYIYIYIYTHTRISASV